MGGETSSEVGAYREATRAEFQQIPAAYVSGAEISPEQTSEAKQQIEEILQGVPYQEQISKVGLGKQRLSRRRYAIYDPEGNMEYWNTDTYPHMRLEEYADSWQTRKNIFRKPIQAPWSELRFTLDYFKEWSEQLTAGKEGVAFTYGASGNLIVSGDKFLYEELGLHERPPMDVFIELLGELKQNIYSESGE
jgi:hypothetical protein